MLSLARKRVVGPKSFSRDSVPEIRIPTRTRGYHPTGAVCASSTGDAWRKGKIPVQEDHGLYAFFRKKADPKLKGEDAFETVESPHKEVSGRAWRASELRLKSFQDLHMLWYVSLRERNLLASQKEEARRAGVTLQLKAQSIMAGHCRKTMARIKAIMNERRIAYQGAVGLYVEKQESVEDKLLLEMQREAYDKAREKLGAFQTRGRALRQGRKQEAAGNAQEEAAQTVDGASSVVEAESISATVEAAEATPEPSAPAEEATPALPTGTQPLSAVDTAAAGLFGEPVRSEKK